LLQGADGKFYGTTTGGGANGKGTVFSITTGGKQTTLYSFAGFPTDGQNPTGALTQGPDGNFYGTTDSGGSSDSGIIFKITATGTPTILHTFTTAAGGSGPLGGLTQGTDGKFYGTTAGGGVDSKGVFINFGTIFSFDLGFGPFVEARPGFAIVGTNITILGNGLTGSTAVSFNSTAAAFAVVSDSEITATVPAGATTGAINVTTPGRPLASNVAFKVVPQVLSFLPTSGPAGTSVVITGESLTGASAVSFGSVLATSFTVNSDTQITATVPTGAATGDVAVRTAGGRGQSATAFTVTP
jgi:uncharacterized repeat protein (TIGR03803 family)